MESIAAAVLGVLAYVGAHFVGKPLLALRQTRESIARSLVFFANVSELVADERTREARGTYRELASTLIAQANSIPFYAVWSFLRVIPTIKNIETARANLIGLSNAVGVQGQGLDNSKRQANIEQALGIRSLS